MAFNGPIQWPNGSAQTALNASVVSEAVQLQDVVMYAVTLRFTGSPCSFTASLLGSTDAPSNVFDAAPVINNTVADSSVTFTSAGVFTYNVFLVGYNWVQLQITDNSGGSNAGIVSATMNCKGPI